VERQLVEQAAKGDPEAFAGLARLSSNRLFAIAYRILRDHHAAEDALQQALVTIWDDLPRLRDPDKFEAWSYRLIVRASVAAARRERRTHVLQLLPSDEDRTGPDQLGAIVERDALERGFNQLSPDHRAVLVLRHFAGLSLAEIAEVLGIPIGTAGSRLHYAARTLRAAIATDAPGVVAGERTA
jgi:RNA polymerase sigma-70 factor (ECF subfamily)